LPRNPLHNMTLNTCQGFALITALGLTLSACGEHRGDVSHIAVSCGVALPPDASQAPMPDPSSMPSPDPYGDGYDDGYEDDYY